MGKKMFNSVCSQENQCLKAYEQICTSTHDGADLMVSTLAKTVKRKTVGKSSIRKM